MLKDGAIDFRGRFCSAEACVIQPRGPRPHGAPILIGTSGERMLELTAKYADIWNVWFSATENDVEKIKPLLARVDDACLKVGRDPKTLARSSAVICEVGPHGPSTMSSPPLTGDPKALADQLRAYADVGVSHLQVWLEPATLQGVESFAAVLAELDRD